MAKNKSINTNDRVSLKNYQIKRQKCDDNFGNEYDFIVRSYKEYFKTVSFNLHIHVYEFLKTIQQICPAGAICIVSDKGTDNRDFEFTSMLLDIEENGPVLSCDLNWDSIKQYVTQLNGDYYVPESGEIDFKTSIFSCGHININPIKHFMACNQEYPMIYELIQLYVQPNIIDSFLDLSTITHKDKLDIVIALFHISFYDPMVLILWYDTILELLNKPDQHVDQLDELKTILNKIQASIFKKNTTYIDGLTHIINELTNRIIELEFELF